LLSSVHERDQQTDTQTNHATPSVPMGCIWLLLRCGLKVLTSTSE